MKKHGMTVFFLLLVIATACSHIQKIDTSTAEEIRFKDVRSIDENRIKELLKPGKGIIIVITKGAAVPVKLNVKTNFIKLANGSDKIIFTEETYLYITMEEVLVSRDKEAWAHIYDIKGLKEVFGNEKGMVDLGLRFTKEEGLVVTFGAAME